MSEVTFIQYDSPPLTAGTYTVVVTHRANQGPPDDFTARTTFAVSGERFKIDPAEIAGVFPPDLANGEYAGALPHVLIARQTLPWERESVPGVAAASWLAVLLLDDAEIEPLQQLSVKDLVPSGQAITVVGSTTRGTGAMPAGTVSYPGLTTLEYGESPDDPVQAIDLPAATFSRVAPAAIDMPYLAHIREDDDADAIDATGARTQLAVVLGNRIPATGARAHALLVSLEGLGPLLPASDGTQSPQLTAATVRLTVFRAWSFFANDGGETFLRLLEGLNAPGGLTSMQVPFAGTAPSASAVEQARAAQAAGTLTAAEAQVLVHDAFGMGYLPLGHHLRHGGETVSWYRGPLAPFAVTAEIDVPLAGPDAATRYDPQTGMFDVSYAAAWQLGQLLALQSRSFALAVLAWRRTLRADAAVQAEQTLIEELLAGAFDGVVARRAAAVRDASGDYPPAIVHWLAKLRLLHGIPFNYLVPDERMLPPESLRAFQVDRAWMDALLDGALSIGRASTGELAAHVPHAAALHSRALAAGRELRRNADPATDRADDAEQVTGFLLRSQVVSGWPNLSVKGFGDAARTTEVPKLRLARLAADVLLCLFDGAIAAFAIREPPQQLHCGVEPGAGGALATTLREIVGSAPGKQYDSDPKGGPASAAVPARADGRTLVVAQAATNIDSKLRVDFDQDYAEFTSAEFALEMVQGVGEVDFEL